MKTILVIALSVLAQAAGNTLLSKGMKCIASQPAFSSGFSLDMLVVALGHPTILVGMATPQQFDDALAAVEKGPLPRAALDRLAALRGGS